MVSALVEKVVGISIALFVAAIMLPLALSQIALSGTNMTDSGVSPVVIIMVTVLLPVLAIIGIVLYFLYHK